MKRKEFIRNTTALGITGLIASNMNATPAIGTAQNAAQTASPFTLPPLPYKYEALEPYIDTQTMQLHHGKHHAAYVQKLNDALAEMKADPKLSLEEIIKNISKYPVAVRNNGGGHFNHSMFWKIMKPAAGGLPQGKLADALNASFGSFEEFKKKFAAAGTSRFGSGWAWLVKHEGKLLITSTPNQDNPLMDIAETKGTPLLCLDVWEHAYYLKYQNLRADYITNWWNLVNWDEVAAKL